MFRCKTASFRIPSTLSPDACFLLPALVKICILDMLLVLMLPSSPSSNGCIPLYKIELTFSLYSILLLRRHRKRTFLSWSIILELFMADEKIILWSYDSQSLISNFLLLSWSLALWHLLVYRNLCNLLTRVYQHLDLTASLWPVQAGGVGAGGWWSNIEENITE
ncbi:uncharacterized protein LOC117923169 [Vitis riparia]|uniref:uncharacterized protein LOC117923169 n=1 Tax=Vitis riparia TaxID=96939 RepID=UPI00155A949E|nr:uncharacterized protein LOC117923169 [Vitis riparia]